MLTRRQLISSAAVAGTTLLSGRLTLPGLYAAEPERKRASKYIDVHTHIGRYVDPTKDLTVDGLLKWMDEHDVEKAVVLPLTSPESTTFLQLTDTSLAAGKAHPDRLIPFCSIDPRTMVSGGYKGLVNTIRAWVDQGAKGFGEHKVGLNFDDPLMMRVYEACQEIGIPLLFHIDNVRGKDIPGLQRLGRALKAFPELIFIGHGPGWWASISGGLAQKDLSGYPKGKVLPGGAIDALMQSHSNLYGDLSAGSGNNSIARDLEFGSEFLIRRQDRIMFGTDYLAEGQYVPQFELFEKLGLPADVEQKIFKGNATRVLKLS